MHSKEVFGKNVILRFMKTGLYVKTRSCYIRFL